jgi:hypothetical protein
VQPLARVLAQPGAPARRPRTVQRGAQDDLEQAVAVEVRGERLADPAHRVGQPRALRGEVLQALRELGRHAVELVAELGELVAPFRRHLRGEVAAPQAARDLEEAGDLALQRARHEERERERQDEEAEQDAGRDQPRAPDVRRGLRRARASRPTSTEEPWNAGAGNDAARYSSPSILTSPVPRGRSALAAAGRVVASTRPPRRTTTSSP